MHPGQQPVHIDRRGSDYTPYVSYKGLVDYVDSKVAQIEKAAAAHDDWHRGQLEAQLALAGRTRAAVVTQLMAGAGVLVSALSWLFVIKR